MNKDIKIAWLLPVCWYYWQPALIEFTEYFPRTKVFTGLFSGFVQGLENRLDVKLVGSFQPIATRKSKSYGSGFTYLSPEIIFSLLQYRPKIIFSSSFGIWTIIALLLKPFCQWRIIIAYEGSSPGVDYLNSPLRLLIRRVMVKGADAFITNSHRGKKYFIQILKAPPDLVFAHPYEIPPLELLDRKLEIKDADLGKYEKPIFLFVGRIIKRKGVDILLKACQKLNHKEKKDYTVLIVGDGEEREHLETFCQKHNLTDNVKWIGRVEYDLLNSFYQNIDVFVLPTWEDTWGVVVLEVMLFGKAVICSTGAGSSELVTDGENGYLFDPNHSEKLAELMEKYIDNPDLISSMGEESKSKMKQYSPKAGGIFLKNAIATMIAKS